ncbi:MAG: EAL domain-containing protein [Cellulomonadaceae bacterium]|nr:EAL domain-containing protein [Cellulomonadaceae bacterium]
MTSVTVLGLGLFALALARSSWGELPGAMAWSVVFLGIAAVVGEMRQIPITRGDGVNSGLSTSGPFVLALVAVGGLGVALVVQIVASVSDDMRSRRNIRKAAFNAAQYALAILLARAVFSGLTGVPFFAGPRPILMSEVGPLLLAGLVMVSVNWLLIGIVVSLVTRRPLGTILGDDILLLFATHAVLLCLGAVAAVVAEHGVAMLVLLAPPVIAVYVTSTVGARLAHQAAHDSLTGLGNRYRLVQQLTRSLDPAEPSATGPGLVILDLDHFKDINDALGHAVGDELLRQVAARLVTAVGDEGLVNRLGGDEFAVVVEGDLRRSQSVAQDLQSALDAPMRVGELDLLVRASAGIAVAPAHGTDAATLMKNADIALYRAKVERDRTSTYTPDLDVNTLERLQILADLRVAIDSGQLDVAYQPQVDLARRRLVGVEALIRWNHPVRGAIPPDSFIPLAENSGLIGELTSYVLETSFAAFAGWRAAGHELRLAVNISARHLSDLGLPGHIRDALARHEVPPAVVVLEITETGILADPARVDVVMGQLRALGVAIAVDDYGTGNASLSYLKRLAIDELKIDRSFVSDMATDHHDLAIVRSTIALALDLGLRVVAEGIEDEATAVRLAGLGCTTGQGYHLDRPTTGAAILDRLERERRVIVPSQPVRS